VVPIDLLTTTDFFDELSDDMIRRLADVAELKRYPAGVLLNEGKRSAKYFYLILEGDISLQMESLTGKTVRLETITPGGAIGFSALIEMEPKRYIGDAKVLTPVKALRFSADQLMLLFYQDFELGFLFMKKIARIAKRRLVYRTLPIPKI